MGDQDLGIFNVVWIASTPKHIFSYLGIIPFLKVWSLCSKNKDTQKFNIDLFGRKSFIAIFFVYYIYPQYRLKKKEVTPSIKSEKSIKLFFFFKRNQLLVKVMIIFTYQTWGDYLRSQKVLLNCKLDAFETIVDVLATPYVTHQSLCKNAFLTPI